MQTMFNIEVVVDEISVQRKLNLLLDDQVKTQIHNEFARFCNPYVPMDEGVLSQTVDISPDCVHYNVPYAHYMYEGIVYGPNIPIIENNQIVGWFSPKGQKKHPTGRSITYGLSKHPKATHHWDKAMFAERGEEFTNAVKEILRRKALMLFG